MNMTNDKKRAEMKTLIAQAYAAGWSKNELAALLGVSAGAVATYASGRSMGTNAIRAQLATLPHRTQAQELIASLIANYEAVLVKLGAELAPWMGPGWKVKRAQDIATRQAWIRTLSSVKAVA